VASKTISPAVAGKTVCFESTNRSHSLELGKTWNGSTGQKVTKQRRKGNEQN